MQRVCFLLNVRVLYIIYTYILIMRCYADHSVSLLQPTSPKYQDFSEQVKDRAEKEYNYTFSESEEVGRT